MITVSLPVRMTIDAAVLARGINQELAKYVNQALRGGFEAAVRARIRAEARDRIMDSPQYLALIGDPRARGEMGLVDPAGAVASVIEGLSAGIHLAIQPARATPSGITGGVTLGVLRQDFADVLAAPGSRFVSANGYTVDWLAWMVLRGDSIILADYAFLGVRPGDKPKGRTGLGIMRKGGGWRVPDFHPPLAGTPADNWLGNALEAATSVFGNIMVEELARRL